MEIKHDELGITETDVKNETNREALLNWKEEINDDIIKMNIQIDGAKAKQKATGEYAPPNWFHKINTKKRLYGRLMNKVNNQLSKINDDKEKSFNQKFLDVCHRELDHDLLKELKSKARAEMQADKYESITQNYL